MKVAIPCWQGRVSPVLDVARSALLVTLERGQETTRQKVSVEGTGLLHRAQHISRLGADVVICGAVSRPLELTLHSVGVDVIANVCGQLDEVLAAFIDGRLDEDVYLMPGCCRLRRRLCAGGRQDGRCPTQQQEGGDRDAKR
mgnify:CR=1 FL=1